MNKTQRLLNILMSISAKKKFNIRELTDEFQVSKRTVMRDLQELSVLGVPLYSELGVNGGYQLLKEKSLPPLYFSENEAVGLFFIAQSLRHYKQLPFDAEIESALNKFYHFLPASSKKRIDQLRSSVMFWVSPRELATPFLADLLDAALDQRIVTIAYGSEKGVSERDIQCIGVYTMNGFWYCPAYCFQARDYRTFRIDRVLSFAPADDQHQRLDFSRHRIQDWVYADNQAPGKEEGVAVVVTLSARGVIKCKSDSWFSRELAILEDGTGRIERSIPLSDVACLVDTVIAYGTDAVVEQPAGIRELILARVNEIQQLYLKK